MGFDGFPAGTLTFLEGIRANNKKAWFEENRDDYQACYVEVGKDFVVAAGEKLAAFAPEAVAEPRINGSLFRINRDIRFSKDKRPYKDHLDFWFWEGERKGAVSGFFARIWPDGVIAGAGCHGFDGPRLEKYRSAVADPASGGAVAVIVAELQAAGYAIGGQHYKRLPRGFEAEGTAADLLRHNALYAHVDEPLSIATTPQVLETIVEHWGAFSPLHRWLIEHVQNG